MPTVACGSRSRFFVFCDLAYVQPRSSTPSGRYQSGMRWGRPRGPTVTTCMMRCSARNARSSSSLIWISSRREGMAREA